MTIGILAIHGYTGGPYEVEPIGLYIERHSSFTVQYVTLRGHGDVLNLRECKYTDWLLDAELAFRRLQRKVDEIIVIGFSMGALIALRIASRYNVKKLVLLSTPIHYLNPSQFAIDVAIALKDVYNKQLHQNRLFQRYKRKLGKVPIQSSFEFMRCVSYVLPLIPTVNTPVFIVQGDKDEMVRPSSAQYLYNKIGSKEKYLYQSKHGKHMICYSEDCERWFKKVMEFIISP